MSRVVDLGGDQEGQTPVDPDDAQYLTEAFVHIRTRADLNDAEADNIADGALWIDDQDLRVDDVLNQTFLRELHRLMFGQVWTWAGKFRQREMTLGVDPLQIQERTQTLLGDVRYWIEHDTYGLSGAGARFHHELVVIHPFVNGNGRHARWATNALAKAVGLGVDHYSWGERSGLSPPEARNRYLSALRAADERDFGPLIDYVVS